MGRHWRAESRGLTWSEFIFYKFSLLAVWGGWEAGVWAGGYCFVQGRDDVGLSWTEAEGMERKKYSEEVKRRQNQQDLVRDCGVEKEEADLWVSSACKNKRCLWWDQHAYRIQKIRKHFQQVASWKFYGGDGTELESLIWRGIDENGRKWLSRMRELHGQDRGVGSYRMLLNLGQEVVGEERCGEDNKYQLESVK